MAAPVSAVADSQHINRLESELADIKSMLSEYGMREADRKQAIAGLLDDTDDFENLNRNLGSVNRDFVQQQKAHIKESQEKLEQAKQQYKSDKLQIEELRLTDPQLYRKKSELLAKVKEDLDRRI